MFFKRVGRRSKREREKTFFLFRTHHFALELPRKGSPEPGLDLLEDLPLRVGVGGLRVQEQPVDVEEAVGYFRGGGVGGGGAV